MSNPKILYILDCKHVQPGRMGVLEMECLNCNDGRIHRIIDVHTYEWRVWCETCNYRPWCGLSQMLANHTCTGHVRKRSWHTAKVLYLENPVAARVRERIMVGGNERASRNGEAS